MRICSDFSKYVVLRNSTSGHPSAPTLAGQQDRCKLSSSRREGWGGNASQSVQSVPPQPAWRRVSRALLGWAPSSCPPQSHCGVCTAQPGIKIETTASSQETDTGVLASHLRPVMGPCKVTGQGVEVAPPTRLSSGVLVPPPCPEMEFCRGAFSQPGGLRRGQGSLPSSSDPGDFRYKSHPQEGCTSKHPPPPALCRGPCRRAKTALCALYQPGHRAAKAPGEGPAPTPGWLAGPAISLPCPCPRLYPFVVSEVDTAIQCPLVQKSRHIRDLSPILPRGAWSMPRPSLCSAPSLHHCPGRTGPWTPPTHNLLTEDT